jgi:hypothetical protein
VGGEQAGRTGLHCRTLTARSDFVHTTQALISLQNPSLMVVGRPATDLWAVLHADSETIDLKKALSVRVKCNMDVGAGTNKVMLMLICTLYVPKHSMYMYRNVHGHVHICIQIYNVV